LRADQTVACWGAEPSRNGGAKAGGSTGPHQVSGIEGAQAIAAGAEHACALVEGGVVKCWGNNQHGQLGNGTVVDSPTPVDVNGIKGAKAIAAGNNNSCAVVVDGGVVCWGTFVKGAKPLVAPVRVAGISGDIKSLATGSNYGCALFSAGTVSCWWGNTQAASAASAPASPFTAAESMRGFGPVQSLAAGYAHTCVLLADGSARCWGNNREGQLGNGKTENSTVPVVVQKLGHATALTAGLAHTCAILADQTARCWGTDSYGVPAGVTFSLRSHEPVPVGRDQTTILTSLNILADVYRRADKFDKAEPLYQRALQLIEKARGPDDESLAPVLKGYAEMLRKAGRTEEAAKMDARAQSILFKPVLTDVPTRPPPSQ
jgi:alpha-tubulin suppressor-like RCC1 family protein